jgi:hypothetical protein
MDITKLEFSLLFGIFRLTPVKMKYSLIALKFKQHVEES